MDGAELLAPEREGVLRKVRSLRQHMVRKLLVESNAALPRATTTACTHQFSWTAWQGASKQPSKLCRRRILLFPRGNNKTAGRSMAVYVDCPDLDQQVGRMQV